MIYRLIFCVIYLNQLLILNSSMLLYLQRNEIYSGPTNKYETKNPVIAQVMKIDCLTQMS